MKNSDNRCRHFTGIQHTECGAGVNYISVRNNSLPLDGGRFPCFGIGGGCAKYEPHTPEELAETERQMQAAIKNLFAFQSRESDTCPHCGKQVTALRQVGRCVYTSCGCRLWQGTVPKAWQS